MSSMCRCDQRQEDGMLVSGLLAVPGFCNDKTFLPEELAHNHGKVVPVYWDHQYKQGPIGKMKLLWDPVKHQLLFEALITEREACKTIQRDRFRLGVSMGGDYSPASTKFCGSENCYVVVWAYEIYEGSITPNPAITSTLGTLVIELGCGC